jgi:hypothetical protein
MSVALSTLITAGYRIAGISLRAGRTPSPEQYVEGLAIALRMFGSWNCDRFKIYGEQISVYNLIAGKKIYTIGGPGLGADFDAARPEQLVAAQIILNTTPASRNPVKILTPQEWRDIRVQDIPNTIPSRLYYDLGFPLANIYLWGQALTTYQLELYTTLLLPTFTAITNTVILPPGYDLAITYNLGKLYATNDPARSTMTPAAYKIADDSLMAVESINAPRPIMRCDASVLSGRQANARWSYLTGE